MKTTVLVFHPSIATSRVNARLTHAAEAIDGVEVRYLYGLYPDFRIDVEAEQRVLEAADRIVWQFPLYWYSSPALLKQWEDDVLTYGWAYGSTGTALHGKELAVAVSPGAAAERYTPTGLYQVTVDQLLLPFATTSKLIGTSFVEPFVTAGAMQISDADLERQAEAYRSWLSAPAC